MHHAPNIDPIDILQTYFIHAFVLAVCIGVSKLKHIDCASKLKRLPIGSVNNRSVGHCALGVFSQPHCTARALPFLVLAAALDPERASRREFYFLCLLFCSGGNRDFWRSLISRNADFSHLSLTSRRHFLRRRLFPFAGGAAANKRGWPRTTPNLQQNPHREKRELYSGPQK